MLPSAIHYFSHVDFLSSSLKKKKKLTELFVNVNGICSSFLSAIIYGPSVLSKDITTGILERVR